jgi:hypothetical protein
LLPQWIPRTPAHSERPGGSVYHQKDERHRHQSGRQDCGGGAIIDKANAGNVPVVFFNHEPFADDMKKWDKVYYVGAKAEESSTMQGEIAAEYWKANPSADKNGDGVPVHHAQGRARPPGRGTPH